MFNALRNLIPPAQVYVIIDTAAPGGSKAIKAHTTLNGARKSMRPNTIIQGPIPVYRDSPDTPFPPNPPNPPNPLAVKYRIPGPYKYLFS
jgi:hypothetical protein